MSRTTCGSACKVESLEVRRHFASVEGFYFEDRFVRGSDPITDPDIHANGLRDPSSDVGVVFQNGGTPRVQLFNAGPNQRLGGGDDVLVAQVNAANNGFYKFDNLPSGFYIVRFRDLPTGFRFQTPDLDFDDPTKSPEDHFDSDANGNGQTQAFFLGSNTAGEASAAIVSNKTPANIVAVFKGFHANSPNTDISPIAGNGLSFGNLRVGQNRTRTLQWVNTGGKSLTIERAIAGVERENDDPTGLLTGRFWEFLTKLNGVTFAPGQVRDVKIRYGTAVADTFGDPGAFVVRGTTFTGPINITADAVTGVGATIREPLKQPRNRDTTYKFRVLYATDDVLNLDTIDDRDVQVRAGDIRFTTRARLIPKNANNPCARELDMGSSNCEVIYEIQAPGGRWDSKDNKRFEFRMLGNAVFDTQGRSSPARTLRDLKVKIGAGARRSDEEPAESHIAASTLTSVPTPVLGVTFSQTTIPSLLADESDAVWVSTGR